MSPVYIRAGRETVPHHAALDSIAEHEHEAYSRSEMLDAPLPRPSWEPLRVKAVPLRTRKRSLASQAYNIPPTIHESPEQEITFFPFPSFDPPLIDLSDDEPVPFPLPTLRRRRRTPTLTVLDFEGEDEDAAVDDNGLDDDIASLPMAPSSTPSGRIEVAEEKLIDFDEDEEDNVDDIPVIYQTSLLSEELPTDIPVIDDEEDEENFVAVDEAEWQKDPNPAPPRIWSFLSSISTSLSSPSPSSPHVPPALERLAALTSPVVRSIVRSPSPLLLPPSSTPPSTFTPPVRPESPITERMMTRPSNPPRIPASPTFVISPVSPSSRLSWTGLPPRLHDLFAGAETEYEILRKLVDSPSAYDDDASGELSAYDSDRTVRQCDFIPRRARVDRSCRSRSRALERPPYDVLYI